MKDQNQCRRCGDCCKNGGPALHRDDLGLFSSGVLETGHLLTLRLGEPAYDQPAGAVAPLEEEVLKLRPGADGKSCMFYDAANSLCAIYENRPLECRLQACWNEEPLRDAYREERICRLDVLAPESAALEIVRLHEQQCGFQALAAAAGKLHAQPGVAAEAAVFKILETDTAFREGVARKLGQSPEELHEYFLFLLGRPMQDSLSFYGLRLTYDGKRARLLRFVPNVQPSRQEERQQP